MREPYKWFKAKKNEYKEELGKELDATMMIPTEPKSMLEPLGSTNINLELAPMMMVGHFGL